jgi:excisionase family DNA binding protein
MSDKVLVPLPDGRWLALAPEVFAEGLRQGAPFNPAAGAAQPAQEEPLLDAKQLAEKLHVPVRRIEDGARQGVIPAVRVGRYVRFRRSAVEAALVNGR